MKPNLLSALIAVFLIISLVINVVLYIDRYYSNKIHGELLIELRSAYRTRGVGLSPVVEHEFEQIVSNGFADRAEMIRLRDTLRKENRGN
jgi:hypothetical protein